MGGRHFETVSSFGSLRFEGCSVIEFAGPGIDDDVLLALRKSAEKVRRIHEHDVFVFGDQTSMESVYKPKPWQGLHIVVPKPSIALCATSDVYLGEVLERMDEEKPLPRALPDDLREWRYVDYQAPCWAIRHIPHGGRQVSGLAWTLQPHGRDVFELTYVAARGMSGRQLAQKLWRPQNLPVHPTIESMDDGTTVVTIDIRKESVSGWYAFPIYWSQGEQGGKVGE
ncbi:MAG TPA: hypothetical protein PK867_12175 [Pirellulales bacterium]|nr:hypothetical protein [Pirellulales bacterium]